VDILIGLLAVIIGVAFCLAGLRYFFILLPIWGFVAGFIAGAALISAVFGDGFMATTLGLVIGFVFGLLFALVSYLFWYVAVVLAAGYTGFVLGTALLASFGADSEWVLFIIGFAVGALFALATIVLRLPVYLVVVNTALSGAAVAIGGVLLLFNQFDREEIGTGVLWQQIEDNWFLWIVWIVVAAIGIGAQLRMMQEALTLPEERWTKWDSSYGGGTPAPA
jgi:hypothetical protein